MVDIKLLVAACAAFIFVWRVFYKKREEAEAVVIELFRTQPHDIVLSILTTNTNTCSKYRTSFTQNLITIGRLDFNTIALSSPLISGEHAVIKWNSIEKLWTVKDMGSTNGTRLNDVIISFQNRQMSEEHPLRDGDILMLAEDIQVKVQLIEPGPVPTTPLRHHSSVTHSRLRVSPRRGLLTAGGPGSSGLSTAGETEMVPVPKAARVEYFSECLMVEFAFLTQVGLDHMHSGSPSEDVVFWETPFGNFQHSSLFGVCDGHMGTAVSRKVPELFPKLLSDLIGGGVGGGNRTSLFVDTIDNPGGGGCLEALHSAFLELDSSVRDLDAGSTATVLLAEKMKDNNINNNNDNDDDDMIKLQVANVGDSFAILINMQTGSVTDLTADHRVANDTELHRLEQLGAPLTNNNTRLCMLNLARALGDAHIKNLKIGLIADPYISPVVQLKANKEHLIVIASDGLWDFVQKSEVADLAMRVVGDWEGVKAFGAALIKLTSQRRGPTDDISVFVARV
eukprot:g3860.t1